MAAQPPASYSSFSCVTLPTQLEVVAGRAELHSPSDVPVPSHVRTPRLGSLSLTSVQSGDPGPFAPVGLSGLEESRQIGLQGTRFVSGVAVQEQLVWKTSSAPLIVT